jgi:hypothetical protein
MKKTVLACIALSITFICAAQTDTTKKDKADTIKIGGIIIIKQGDKNDTSRNKKVIISNRNRKRKLTNLSTNWWIVDVGFANFHDKTDYASVAAQQFAPGSTKDWFELRTGKSVNVNIWAFMQKIKPCKALFKFKIWSWC